MRVQALVHESKFGFLISLRFRECMKLYESLVHGHKDQQEEVESPRPGEEDPTQLEHEETGTSCRLDVLREYQQLEDRPWRNSTSLPFVGVSQRDFEVSLRPLKRSKRRERSSVPSEGELQNYIFQLKDSGNSNYHLQGYFKLKTRGTSLFRWFNHYGLMLLLSMRRY